MVKTHCAIPLFLLIGLSAMTSEAKPYKGAEVYTQAQYRYGRIEVRMRMARGSGILSTFFTYKNGSEAASAIWEEIDVEVFGKANATTWQSNIIVGNPKTSSEQVHTAGVSLADAYHTYTVEWAPEYVAWLVDGVEVRRTRGGQANQLINPEGLRFNLWVSDSPSWVGAFDPAVLPQYQYVNWIRYYRYEGGAFVLDWTDDFNAFDTGRWQKASWTFGGNLVDFDPNNAVVRDGTLILCLTREGQTGYSGTVPADESGAGTGGASGSGGTGGMGGTSGTGGISSTGGTRPGGTGGTASSGGSINTGGSTGPVGNGGTIRSGGTLSTSGSGGASSASGGARSGGSLGTGGAANTNGSGGMDSTGGSTRTGGNAGAGNTGGISGSAVTGGDGAGAGDGGPRPTQIPDNGGCSCSLTRGGTASGEWMLWLTGLGLWVLRRCSRKRSFPTRTPT